MCTFIGTPLSGAWAFKDETVNKHTSHSTYHKEEDLPIISIVKGPSLIDSPLLQSTSDKENNALV